MGVIPLLCVYISIIISTNAYFVHEEPAYLENFNNLIGSSYSTPLPSSLSSICTNTPTLSSPLEEIFIDSDMDAITFQNKVYFVSLSII